jgi:hypothetical protein
LDIARFKPVGIKKDEIDKRSFLRLSFVNTGLDAITLGISFITNKSKDDCCKLDLIMKKNTHDFFKLSERNAYNNLRS